MPRMNRSLCGGYCFHVLNRGNGRAKVFHDAVDYDAMIVLLDRACERLPMRVLAYCLMPNHFHLVLQPFDDTDLSRWMHWLMTSHVRRYHRRYQTSGHVWQGRFKAFAVQNDRHLYTVLRYVERNPVRAELVEQAQHWLWSSLRWRRRKNRPRFLTDSPIALPADWIRHVNRPQTLSELEAIRLAISRGAPFGNKRWNQQTAQRMGIEASLNPHGRPHKARRRSYIPLYSRKSSLSPFRGTRA